LAHIAADGNEETWRGHERAIQIINSEFQFRKNSMINNDNYLIIHVSCGGGCPAISLPSKV